MTTNTVEHMQAEAMKAHREGRLDDAEFLCRKALKTDPSSVRSLIHLSVLARNKGDFKGSKQLAERVIELEPETVDGYVQLGLTVLASGEMNEAASAFAKAVLLAPNLSPAHYNLGLALENLGEQERAKRAFLEAIRFDPKNLRARLSLGTLYLNSEDTSEARLQTELALADAPGSADANLLMAKVCVAEGHGAEAESHIRTALAANPSSSLGLSMLGFRLMQKGKFDEAISYFERAIQSEPLQGLAYFGITQSKQLTNDDQFLLEKMKRVLEEPALNSEQTGFLHFALAKAYDGLKDYESSMEHYDAAHENARASLHCDTAFDRQHLAGMIKSTVRLYTGQMLRGAGPNLDTDMPIFIVGMMRSGTTLVEQILSCHPAIGAGGEQTYWPSKLRHAEDLDARTLDRGQLRSLAEAYIELLQKFAPGSDRITDKLPDNYMRLGALHLAMPKAKFIHVKRNPVDNALSIYMVANPVTPSFAHRKEDIVYTYRRYQELMEHWRAVLPASSIHEVQYEQLVENKERIVRGMLEFLELDFDEACLDPDRNAREVRTLSLWQVRQPIYSSSVGRWRRYEPWLGALKELVEA
jgi:tetratricopeptide (TPR) repeat protein